MFLKDATWMRDMVSPQACSVLPRFLPFLLTNQPSRTPGPLLSLASLILEPWQRVSSCLSSCILSIDLPVTVILKPLWNLLSSLQNAQLSLQLDAFVTFLSPAFAVVFV